MLNITKANLMENIAELEKLGFKRWTKNGMDRLYINAQALGLDREHGTLNGKKISNTYTRELASAKTYIDLNTFTIISSSCELTFEVAVRIGLEDLEAGLCKLAIK